MFFVPGVGYEYLCNLQLHLLVLRQNCMNICPNCKNGSVNKPILMATVRNQRVSPFKRMDVRCWYVSFNPHLSKYLPCNIVGTGPLCSFYKLNTETDWSWGALTVHVLNPTGINVMDWQNMRGKEKKLGWSVVDQIFQRCFHVLGSSTCARDVAQAFVGELAGPCNEVLCPGWVLGCFAYVEKVFDISCQHPRTIIIAKCIRIIPLKNVKHIFPQSTWNIFNCQCQGVKVA